MLFKDRLYSKNLNTKKTTYKQRVDFAIPFIIRYSFYRNSKSK